jgi:hypothetical protein|uniref:Uncharacterized protein n=1 Tax=candidate division WOR-3 bacterium TaxID=2052148 RepID=A0A7V3UZX6_UNCW3
MTIRSGAELKQAVRNKEPEILISDPQLIKMVSRLMVLRMITNVLFFAILAVAVLMWANPLRIPFFEAGAGRLTRQILLLFGILLLFADYLMPVARFYKISARTEGQLRLKLRGMQK